MLARVLEVALRIGVIVATAVAGHLVALGGRALSRRLLASTRISEAKVQTLSGFATSVVVFALYFTAIGLTLSELGISITAYLASASIIGLAVSFGSQGVVQDVITGLTLVSSDLIDVGDLVEVGGQTGIVDHVGIRFTVLVNFSGARVFIPNRTVGNVVNYPQGFVRAFVDVRLPGDAALAGKVEARARELSLAAYEEFPGVILVAPSVEGRDRTSAGYEYLRLKFRIWPGQGALIEGPVKQSLVQSLRDIDPTFADWMVATHYRAESRDPRAGKRLPRPAAVRSRPTPPGGDRERR